MSEDVVARLKPHGRALFWPTVLLLVVAGAVGFLAGVLREEWQIITMLVVAGMLALVGWFAPLCRWLARNYAITSRRVVVRSGILVRVRQEILHSRVQDVTLRTSGLQTVFRSGDVLLSGGLQSGDAGSVVLRDVPSAALVQAALGDLADGAVSVP